MKPSDKGLEDADVVGDASVMSTGVVRIEIFVDVEYELAYSTSGVSDREELRARFGRELGGTRPA